MPMPTTSPASMDLTSTDSSVSSTRCGSPHRVPVAAARTYSQRGVMTATPNDSSLGLMRWTRGVIELLKSPQVITPRRLNVGNQPVVTVITAREGGLSDHVWRLEEIDRPAGQTQSGSGVSD